MSWVFSYPSSLSHWAYFPSHRWHGQSTLVELGKCWKVDVSNAKTEGAFKQLCIDFRDNPYKIKYYVHLVDNLFLSFLVLGFH